MCIVKRRRPSRRRGERGSNIVEFALILPPFLLLIFGLIDLGRGVYLYNAVANAAREGARYGIVLTPDDYYTLGTVPVAGNAPGTYTASGYAGTSTVVGKTTKSTTLMDLSRMQVTVTAPAVFFNAPLTVAVAYPFDPIVPRIVGTSSVTITASSTMIFN